VRLNGRLYEALVASLEHRPRRDLYHSALEVRLPGTRYLIESAPIRPRDGADRGVVGEGPVGTPWARRFRLFRYELRVWRRGRIPDIGEAVESPYRLSTKSADAQRLLRLAPLAPTPTWGRDELGAGEMWNSNSFIAWLITATGLDVDAVQPPNGGRAPGWDAGVEIARRRPPTAVDLESPVAPKLPPQSGPVMGPSRLRDALRRRSHELACSGGLHGRRERRDVVGAVVSQSVDKERRRARDAGKVG
jgi:hypothetical protein